MDDNKNQTTFLLRLPRKLKEDLDRVARWERRSLNSQIVRLLEFAVKGYSDSRDYEAHEAEYDQLHCMELDARENDAHQ